MLIIILILNSCYDIIILSEAAVAVASNLREREVAGSNPIRPVRSDIQANRSVTWQRARKSLTILCWISSDIFFERHLLFAGFRLYYRFIAFLKDFVILKS